MPLQYMKEDVLRAKAEVIVNPASRTLRPTGGVSAALFAAAGAAAMRAACEAIGGCPPGGAVITPGFGLPARWVVHAVGPLWLGGFHGEADQLAACYRKALRLAADKGASSIALPLLSAGAYGYPKDKAFQVARETIAAFLEEREMTVCLSVYDARAARPEPAAYGGLLAAVANRGRGLIREAAPAADMAEELPSLEDMLSGLGETKEPAPEPTGGFMARAMELMREKGLNERALCRRANMSRAFFAGLRAREPERRAALALCVGLALSLEETNAMLARAGGFLSGSDRADVIAAWSIARGEDIFRLNAALYALGEAQLVFL